MLKRKETCISWSPNTTGVSRRPKEKQQDRKGRNSSLIKEGRKKKVLFPSVITAAMADQEKNINETQPSFPIPFPISHQPCRLLRAYPTGATYDGLPFQCSSGSRLSRTTFTLCLLQSDGFRMYLGGFWSVSINPAEFSAE